MFRDAKCARSPARITQASTPTRGLRGGLRARRPVLLHCTALLLGMPRFPLGKATDFKLLKRQKAVTPCELAALAEPAAPPAMLSHHASSPVRCPLIPCTLRVEHEGLFAWEWLCGCGEREGGLAVVRLLSLRERVLCRSSQSPISSCPQIPDTLGASTDVESRRERSHSPLRQRVGVPCTPQGGAAVLEGVAAMTKGTR